MSNTRLTKTITIKFKATAGADGKIDTQERIKITWPISFSNANIALHLDNCNEEKNHNIIIENSSNNIKLETTLFGCSEERVCISINPLMPGNKTFRLQGDNFSPGESVVIVLTLYTWATNMHVMTNEVLNDSKSEGITNAFCAGITDHVLTYFGRLVRELDPLEVVLENTHQTTLKVEVYHGIPNPGGPIPIFFKIDPDKELITSTISLKFDFLSSSDKPYCSVTTLFTLDLRPIMATSTHDELMFTIEKAELSGQTNFLIYDRETIIKEFGSEEIFTNYLTHLFNQVKEFNIESQFKGILPSIIGEIRPPDTWKNFEGYRAHFEFFKYKKGYLNGEPAGFLFAVFSIHSLHLPPPCICPDKNILDENTNQESEDIIRNQYKDDDYCSYNNIYTVGFSEEALTEVVRPMLSISSEGGVSANSGVVFGTARYWFKVEFDKVEIPDTNKVSVLIKLVEAGGKVEAKGRGTLGRVGPKKSIAVDIILENTRADFTFNSKRIPGKGWVIHFLPDVHIGKLDIDLSSTDIPYPIDVIVDEISEVIEDKAKPNAESYMNNQLTRPFFISKGRGGASSSGFGFLYVRTDFYPNSSIVITGESRDD